jgi:hypothetical protein
MATNKIEPQLYLGNSPLKPSAQEVVGDYVVLAGEPFYRIRNFDAMEPFFMSIVSSSDHWLFISSSGGLTAGRVSADSALFPYYTVDRITENGENTGNKAILIVHRSRRTSLWEPLSVRQQGQYLCRRNLYKNIPGSVVMFEEQNIDLGLTYRYSWRTSEKYGFVKTTSLVNTRRSGCRVELLDGVQNILPAGVQTAAQNTFSPLLDAYKHSELGGDGGLAIFTLNSNLTDLAEPSESLVASTAFQVGLNRPGILLSSQQLDRFRQVQRVGTETEVRGQRGAYFVHALLDLGPGSGVTWYLLADVDQDSRAIVERILELRNHPRSMPRAIERDLSANSQELRRLVAEADGLQLSRKPNAGAHHFANVLFNIMRGGLFADQYGIRAQEFMEFLAGHNRPLAQRQAAFLDGLPEVIPLDELESRAMATGDADLIRLSHSYLPLTFSRRHGDPSRPWNRFAIRIKRPDGSRRLDYEGNWRDIFQNWEALALSYPGFVENMIFTFLNATTADGYNPYRIGYQGVDWELPEPGNPWANLGYWSDHQIIYLLKLLEFSVRVHPGRLQGFLDRAVFSDVQVPYRIKPYPDLIRDPFNTIEFDWDLQHQIEARVADRGADGKLVTLADGGIRRVTFTEKLLVLLLAKLANFVPEGGIWMNTQRPEWNDANNALVGKGLSVVTLCYLRRYLVFFRDFLAGSGSRTVAISPELQEFYSRVDRALKRFEPALVSGFDDQKRRLVMDELGMAGNDYRSSYYLGSLSARWTSQPVGGLVEFLDRAQRFVEHSLRANRRSDALYASYNILQLASGTASIRPLYEMLEGQVAILASGLLNGAESLRLLEQLRRSSLYQAEQHSYLLYPDRELRPFLEKSLLAPEALSGMHLVDRLVEMDDRTLIVKDALGAFHFSGRLRNARDVRRVLDVLRADPRCADLAAAEGEAILAIFEATFRHAEFTGRSSTFFAYEGLGSIYWHMVSKLLLAVQETAVRVRQEGCAPALVDRYQDIRQGLGFNKSPRLYGAFPTDPYSHTPRGQGAKQPGMSGQVKEAILTRLGELGLSFENGCLAFDPLLLDRQELLATPATFHYLDVQGREQVLAVGAGALAFTICQTPVIVETAARPGLMVSLCGGRSERIKGLVLDPVNSRHIFQRDGEVHHLTVRYVGGGTRSRSQP